MKPSLDPTHPDASPSQRPAMSSTGPSAMADLSRYATGFKLALIFLLVLAFLIPLWMLSSLTDERQNRRREAASEVALAWAGPLTIASPVIIIPCDYRYRDSQDREASASRAVVIHPEKLLINGQLDPQVRQRGIFSIPLFTMDATMSGSFRRPPLAALGADVIRAHWEQAYLAIVLPDYRCLNQSPLLFWDEQALALDSPRPDMDLNGPVLAASLENIDWTKPASFRLQLSLKGSDQLAIHSMAESTQAKISSSWPQPSFFGSALPDERQISESGMAAQWNLVRYGQGLAGNAAMEGGMINGSALLDGSSGEDSDSFGFRLYQGNSVYQLTDRSLKYGILFIIIPFVALFLLEAIRRSRVHPVQYVLIGVANCLFFLLLLALSEQISFNPSFLIAALITIILSSWYCANVLPRRRDGWLMATLLAGLYGYMFVALQSEDYALLIGSIGLVLIVAGVMFTTRKIDWYRLGRRPG